MCLFQALDIGGAQTVQAPEIGLPGIVVRPRLRGYGGGARRIGVIEHRERAADGGRLRITVERFACGVPERKVAEPESRHADMLDDVPGAAQDDGGDSMRFQVPGDQTDRLVADRSRWHEQCRLGIEITRRCKRCGCILLHRDTLTAVGWHTDQLRRKRADSAISNGPFQCSDG